ncbi:hypothetical protein HK097_000037 [Rhizophlyctis rosea]|uniref:Uncharacterized protein n=1 Tax=Rhizophlyctis rosea TaxID=64517 RepID=A0AAD5X9L7_9FUNG|nr:hypothetical protein HK097_000037 [Rhizophlyctis rosea]
MEAKSAISDPDTGLTRFLSEALSEAPQEESRGRSLPTPPSRNPRPSTNLPRPPEHSSVRMINPPDPPRGFTSDPNLRGPARGMSPAGRMAARGAQNDESDEDDELFDMKPKKGQVSLAEFLRTSEPPPPSKPVPLVDPTKVKKGLFARKQSTSGPSGAAAAPAGPKKYTMIHIPYELPELDFAPTTSSLIPSVGNSTSSVPNGVTQSYSAPSTPTTPSWQSQSNYESRPSMDVRPSMDGVRPSMDGNRHRRVPEPPVNSSRIPTASSPQVPSSPQSLNGPNTPSAIQRKPVPLPTPSPTPVQVHLQHHQATRVAAPNPVVEPESQRAVVLNIPTPVPTPPASPVPEKVKPEMIDHGTDAEVFEEPKPLMKDKETEATVSAFKLEAPRMVKSDLTGKSLDEVVTGLVALDAAFGVVAEVMREVKVAASEVGADRSDDVAEVQEVVEDGKWVVLLRRTTEGKTIEATIGAAHAETAPQSSEADAELVDLLNYRERQLNQTLADFHLLKSYDTRGIYTYDELVELLNYREEQLNQTLADFHLLKSYETRGIYTYDELVELLALREQQLNQTVADFHLMASMQSEKVVEVVEVPKTCGECERRDAEAFSRSIVDGVVDSAVQSKEDQAAVVIQNAYRRHRADASKDVEIAPTLTVEDDAARVIQNAYRKHRTVAAPADTPAVPSAEEDAARVIQSAYRKYRSEDSEVPQPAVDIRADEENAARVIQTAYRNHQQRSVTEPQQNDITTAVDTQTPPTPTSHTPTQTAPTPVAETTTQTQPSTPSDSLTTISLTEQVAALQAALISERNAREKAERVAESRNNQIAQVRKVVEVQEKVLGVLARVAYGVVESESAKRKGLEGHVDGLIGYAEACGGSVCKVDA